VPEATPEGLPSRRQALWIAVVGLCVSWLLLVAAPLIPGLPPRLGTVLVSGLLAAATFAAIYGLAAAFISDWYELAGIVICGGLWFLVGDVEAKGLARIFLGATASVLFMLACVLFGRLVSRLVREPNLLLPVLITAAVADVFTVTVGPTHMALEKADKVVRSLSVAVPQAGSAAGKEGVAGLTVAASIGLGDFIFAALFLTAAWRHGLEVRTATLAAAFLAVLGMSLVLLVPQIPALPLLPFIVVGVLVPNAGRFRLSSQEKLALAVGGVFLVLLLGGFYLATR